MAVTCISFMVQLQKTIVLKLRRFGRMSGISVGVVKKDVIFIKYFINLL